MSGITREIEHKYREEITREIIEALRKGTAPWQQNWSNCIPVNAVTGNPIRGVNACILSMESLTRGDGNDCRWATRKQAESKKWSIKPGAKPVKIILYKYTMPPKNGGFKSKRIIFVENENSDNNSKKKNGLLRLFYEVYHASQINGIPELQDKAKIKRSSNLNANNEFIRNIIYNSGAVIGTDVEAYYRPKDDIIMMPSRKAFFDMEGYYATLLHEIVHWSGHESRLNRFVSWIFDRSDKEYAREELVAELASMFILSEAGLRPTEEHFNNHASYIDSWISLLKSDPNEIFEAAQKAQQAADFILAFKERDEKFEAKRAAVLAKLKNNKRS